MGFSTKWINNIEKDTVLTVHSCTVQHTHTHNHLTAFYPGLPRWAGTRRNIHPLTPILIIGHALWTSSIYYDLQLLLFQFMCLTVLFHNLSSLQVLFGLPLGLGPCTSYSMHFFTQSSSFRNTCPYHRSLLSLLISSSSISAITAKSSAYCTTSEANQ